MYTYILTFQNPKHILSNCYFSDKIIKNKMRYILWEEERKVEN